MTKAPEFREQVKKDNSRAFNVHTDLQSKSVEELRDIQGILSKALVRVPYEVCLLNFTGDLNIGVSIRSSCLMGARKVHVFGRREYDARSTVGAQNYVDVDRVDGLDEHFNIDIQKFLRFVDAADLFPIYVEQGGGRSCTRRLPFAADIRDIIERGRGNRTPCFVFGNESFGIPADLLDKANLILELPQIGVLRSFNASAAVTMVLYDYVWGAR
jgi:tRNA G18 (ribose-2'-O)-methylase SpoU